MSSHPAKKKKKQPSLARHPRWQFTLLWIALYGAVALFDMFFFGVLRPLIPFEPAIISQLLFGITIWSLIPEVIGQSLVLKWQYGWSARRWLLASAIGWSMIFAYQLWRIFGEVALTVQQQMLATTVLTATLAVCQAAVLRRHVKHTGLWIAAAIISIVMFYIPQLTGTINQLILLVVPANLVDVRLTLSGIIASLGYSLPFLLTLFIITRFPADKSALQHDHAIETTRLEAQSTQSDDTIPATQHQAQSIINRR